MKLAQKLLSIASITLATFLGSVIYDSGYLNKISEHESSVDSDFNLSSIENSMPEVSGTVYREYEFNGDADIEDAYRFAELGIEDVTVNVYDEDMMLLNSATSNSTENYNVDVSAATGIYVMIEFIPPTGYKSGPSGLNNSSALYRAAVGSTGNDFTIGDYTDHCQDNPTIATACFPGPVLGPNSTIVTLDFEDSENFTGTKIVIPMELIQILHQLLV